MYPDEFKIVSTLSYPEKYILIGCQWLHDWRGFNDSRISETALKYFLLRWERYVGNCEDIQLIANFSDLVKMSSKYKYINELLTISQI